MQFCWNAVTTNPPHHHPQINVVCSWSKDLMVRIQHWFGGVGAVTQEEGIRYIHHAKKGSIFWKCLCTFVSHCRFMKNKKSSQKWKPNRYKIKTGLTPINSNFIAPKSLPFYTRHVTNFIRKLHQGLCEKGTCELALREMLSFFLQHLRPLLLVTMQWNCLLMIQV